MVQHKLRTLARWTGRLCTGLLGVSLLALTGCMPKVTPTPEPVAITFAFPPFDADRDAYEALTEAFNERYPHITVEPQQWAYWQGFNAADADVVTVFRDLVQLLRDQESIMALDAYIQQDESFDLADLHPSAAAHFSQEEERWAIPVGMDVVVMYYNVDLFDQYGVPYPELGWTWEDFFEKAIALRDPGAGVYGYAPLDAGPGTNLGVVPFIYQHGGRIVDDLHDPTSVTFSDPLTVEALDWYATLVHDYGAVLTPQRSYSEFGVDDPSVAIVTGKLGMWSDSFSGTREVKDNVDWGMVPLPRDERSVTMASILGYAISAETAYPDASWKWITFLSTSVYPGLIPVRRSVLESEAYEQRVGGDVVDVALATLEETELVSYWTLFTRFGSEMRTFDRAIDQILSGEASPQEAMDWAQSMAQK
jgi:multiple sugar transport system substrate-binding protein